jgi:hypothetical protein
MPSSRLVAEGRFAIVTKVRRGCGGRGCARLTSGTEAYGEIVWSWRPRDLAPSPGEAEGLREGDGGKQDGSPRRARISRQTTAQGRPVVTACTCGFRALCAIFCAGAPGAAATRPSLRPLSLKRVIKMQNSGETRREAMDARLLRSGALNRQSPFRASGGH